MAAGLLGLVSTVVLDSRAGDTSDLSYTVSVSDMAELGHEWFRVGGFVGYLSVGALLVCAAVWHRRVVQRFTSSVGASVVMFGLVASAAALTLACGWKGALGNYVHGAAESDTYDDAGLTWMAFRERLVSQALGTVTGVLVVGKSRILQADAD